MFLVGLTGGIATGKSTVSKTFKELGAQVIDADIVAREVVEPGKTAWKRIRDEFGSEVVKSSGEIDKAKLGDIVFNDAAKRRRLNAIVHPQVYRRILWMVIGYFLRGNQFVVLDLPLLFESGVVLDFIHKIIVVSCDGEQQLRRLVDRNGLTEADAKKRIASQMDLEEKCKRANFVIDNSGGVERTRQQVELVHAELVRSRRHWRLRLLIVGWFVAVATALAWFTGHLGG